MIFDLSTASHLKPWLVRTLEPICDAEPGALADYILALLKHNVPESEMRKELAIQLEEFLEKECSSFIETLFTVLRTKSYLPYIAPSPPSIASETPDTDVGIPIPLDGLLSPSPSSPSGRSLKRRPNRSEEDGVPPAKGPRLSTEIQFSKYSDANGGRRSTRRWNGQIDGRDLNDYGNEMDVDSSAGNSRLTMNGFMKGRRQQNYYPPELRGICRDYYNTGYCSRGTMCKFSHGANPIVPGLFPVSGTMPIPFMPMFSGANNFGFAGLGGSYDPNEAHMDMGPRGGRPPPPAIMAREQTDLSQILQASGELPVIQDLTPVVTENCSLHRQTHPPAPQLQSPDQKMSFLKTQSLEGKGIKNGQSNDPSSDATSRCRNGPMAIVNINNIQRSGSFSGDASNIRPQRRDDKTLVVEKIPHENLSLEQVNQWFKRFGTVTNVAVDSSTAKALISFLTHAEAYSAWRCEDAVFGNRFVKVFWHRPMEGHGQVGAKLLAASAPVIASLSQSVSDSPAETTPSKLPAKVNFSESCSSVISLAARQQLLEKQILEQKSLMATLENATGEHKKVILSRLRKLGEEIRPTSIIGKDQSLSARQHEEKEREKLDRELELHSVSAPAKVGDDGNTAALKAELETLKAEAARLGISDSGEVPHKAGYRPYRGRGRGMWGHRGTMRGGHLSRSSMKLDNRPKSLLVKGVQDLQSLREWFQSAGQLESIESLPSGDALVSFRSRTGAEQGLAKGNIVPNLGTIQINWHSENSPMAPGPNGPPSEVASLNAPDATRKDVAILRPISTPSSPVHDEEVVTSGWGEDGDGEDGMGML